MLQVESTFPHAGSTAFLKGSGERVRIIQNNACGTCLVQRMGPMARAVGASRTRTVAKADLAETQEAANTPQRKPRRRKAA